MSNEEIRGLHSLGKQKNPRRSWFSTPLNFSPGKKNKTNACFQNELITPKLKTDGKQKNMVEFIKKSYTP